MAVALRVLPLRPPKIPEKEVRPPLTPHELALHPQCFLVSLLGGWRSTWLLTAYAPAPTASCDGKCGLSGVVSPHTYLLATVPGIGMGGFASSL